NPARNIFQCSTGHIHIEPEVEEGVVRKVFHTLYLGDTVLPSFASVIYEEASGRRLNREIPHPRPQAAIVQADPMRINFYGPASLYRHVSVGDILDGLYPSAFFADKIVIVGATAEGIEKKFLTSFTQERNPMSSAEVHAQILNNLLDKTDIRDTPAWAGWLWCLVFSFLCFRFFTQVSEKKAAALCLLALVVGMVFTFALFSLKNRWLSPVVSSISIVFMFLTSYFIKLDMAVKRLEEESSEVVSYLNASDPEIAVHSFRGGVFRSLSVGGINSAVEMLTRVTDHLMTFDRLKSLFIASMSHELRTPLNSIIGFTGILLQGLAGPLNEEQKKQLGIVKASSQHLLELITDVIDLSKIEAGAIDLSSEHVDLARTVREVLATFRPAAARKSLHLDITAPECLIAQSDERRVRQILVNLIGNSLKFTEKGGVSVCVAEKNGRAEVAVSDSGSGIRQEDMVKLFRSFSQITSPDMPKHEGTGLGLYLSRKLALLMGGDIAVESEFGKGSTFTLSLPLRLKRQ
ncbi:MAG TPA: ATP-binding protein, partial [Dissulfurispiraceae bacterium]|nr:ATP-binding protein [Dissulfurispiraceae bacterium]